MKTLTVRIESLRCVGARVVEVVKSGKVETTAGLSFPTYDLKWSQNNDLLSLANFEQASSIAIINFISFSSKFCD